MGASATKTGREHLFEVRLADKGDMRGLVSPETIEKALTIGLAQLDAWGKLDARKLVELQVELMR